MRTITMTSALEHHGVGSLPGSLPYRSNCDIDPEHTPCKVAQKNKMDVKNSLPKTGSFTEAKLSLTKNTPSPPTSPSLKHNTISSGLKHNTPSPGRSPLSKINTSPLVNAQLMKMSPRSLSYIEETEEDDACEACSPEQGRNNNQIIIMEQNTSVHQSGDPNSRCSERCTRAGDTSVDLTRPRCVHPVSRVNSSCPICSNVDFKCDNGIHVPASSSPLELAISLPSSRSDPGFPHTEILEYECSPYHRAPGAVARPESATDLDVSPSHQVIPSIVVQDTAGLGEVCSVSSPEDYSTSEDEATPSHTPSQLLIDGVLLDPRVLEAKMLAAQNRSSDEDDEIHEDEMSELRAMTARLNLSTRRPSYIAWKEKHMKKKVRKHTLGSEGSEGLSSGSDRDSDVSLNSDTQQGIVDLERRGFLSPVIRRYEDKEWTAEKKAEINGSLQWLRHQLVEMREQDRCLARTLMNLRLDIHRVKLQRSNAHNKEILESAMDQIEDERDELADLCDLPPDQFSPTLKHFGVTRAHFNNRRFSVF